MFTQILNSSFLSIDRTQSGATTPGLSGPGSDVNIEVLRIPQSFCIREVSPSDCLMSYTGHSLGESYAFAEMQLVYSTALADLGSFNLGNLDVVDNNRVFLPIQRSKLGLYDSYMCWLVV